jgi:hypothetical protein
MTLSLALLAPTLEQGIGAAGLGEEFDAGPPFGGEETICGPIGQFNYAMRCNEALIAEAKFLGGSRMGKEFSKQCWNISLVTLQPHPIKREQVLAVRAFTGAS